MSDLRALGSAAADHFELNNFAPAPMSYTLPCRHTHGAVAIASAIGLGADYRRGLENAGCREAFEQKLTKGEVGFGAGSGFN